MKRSVLLGFIIVIIALLATIFLVGYVRSDANNVIENRVGFHQNLLNTRKQAIIHSFEKMAFYVFNETLNTEEVTNQLERLEIHENPNLRTDLRSLYRSVRSFKSIYQSGYSNVSFVINDTLNLVSTREGVLQRGKIAPEIIALHRKAKKDGFAAGSVYKNRKFGYAYVFNYPQNELENYSVELFVDLDRVIESLIQEYTDLGINFIITNLRGDSTEIPNDGKSTLTSISNEGLLWYQNDVNTDLTSVDELCEIPLLDSLKPGKERMSSHPTTRYKIDGKNFVMAFTMFTDHPNITYIVAKSADPFIDEITMINSRILLTNMMVIVIFLIISLVLTIAYSNSTKQKKALQASQSKLSELNLSKDKFFSIIAHDLKNPFNGIMGMSGYLYDERNHVSRAELMEIVQDINTASKNAYNLLQNLLDWARSHTNTIGFTPEPLDPTQMIAVALETVTSLAAAKDIELEIQNGIHDRCFADENMVSTVIRNLVTNSIKFTPRSGKITIGVKKFKDTIVFSVSDNGIGLHENEVDALFRIDVSMKKNGTEQETGSGLGLILCKEFVERNNGKIWVISEIGKGSTFFFTLPIYKNGNGKSNKTQDVEKDTEN